MVALICLLQNGLLFGLLPGAGIESNRSWPMAQIRSASVFVIPQAPNLCVRVSLVMLGLPCRIYGSVTSVHYKNRRVTTRWRPRRWGQSSPRGWRCSSRRSWYAHVIPAISGDWSRRRCIDVIRDGIRGCTSLTSRWIITSHSSWVLADVITSRSDFFSNREKDDVRSIMKINGMVVVLRPSDRRCFRGKAQKNE